MRPPRSPLPVAILALVSLVALAGPLARAEESRRGRLRAEVRRKAEGGGRPERVREEGEDVRQLAPESYRVSRAAAGRLAGDARLRTTRVVPALRDGQVVGFRLLRVHPDGPLAVLGLQSGDVIVAVNGMTTASAEQAREAYARVKGADRVLVAVEREGKRLRLEYVVR